MNHQKPLVIYGIGQLTESFVKKSEHEKCFDIIAFTADAEYIIHDSFLDKPLIPFEDIQNRYPPNSFDMLILIGYKNMRQRIAMFEKAKSKGYKLPNYIGTRAIHYQDTLLGENNLIYSGAYIGPQGEMADNNIIRPMTYLGHNFKVGSHNYISPNCSIGGNCVVGDGCFIGIGSTIIDGTKIADETLLAAGSILISDTEPFSVYAGSPAKKIKEHKETGIEIFS